LIRFAIIGTNFITDRLIESGRLCEGFEVSAVYSRSLERAQEYAKRYGIATVYDNLDALASSQLVDAVYIASPNYCHKAQTVKMLNSKKHVLVEKPAAANAAELEEMITVARENDVVLMEALRTVFCPEFQAIRAHLHKLGTIRRATFSYCQYSSRYDKFKNGIVENAFRPELCNSALMDIGVYCVNALVELFGEPASMQANGIRLSNGFEGAGAIAANYGDMQAEVLYSKITNSFNPSEIQGERGCMTIYELPNPRKIEIIYNDGKREDLGIQPVEPNMQFQVREFIRLIENKESADVYNQRSLVAMRMMDQARVQMGIHFPND